MNPQILRQSAVTQLQMEKVTDGVGKFVKNHEERFFHHDDVEAIQLLDNSQLERRLKKNRLSWCGEQ